MALSKVGKNQVDEATNFTVQDGTIKLDGNYPVGTGNVALGDAALSSGSLSGDYNVAIGNFSLAGNTTASGNVSVGRSTLGNNQTGSANTAIGSYDGTTLPALYYNTSGSYNTATGVGALGNTTSSNNTAVGYQAGYTGTQSGHNTYIGHQAGYAADYGSAANTYNTFVGSYAGSVITTGAKNVIIGGYNGNLGGLDIRTSSNNIVLSDGDGNPRQYFSAGTWFIPDYGAEAAADTRFKLNVGNQSDWAMVLDHAHASNQYYFSFRYLTTQIGSIIGSATSTAFNTSSDYRLKENVTDLTGAADRVQQLAPKRFNFIADADKTVDGFLAHEVADIVPEAISGEKDAVDADGNPEYQGIDQSKLVPLLTAALQEALTKIDALETRIVALEAN